MPSVTTQALPIIPNQAARHLFMQKHGLGGPGSGTGKGADLKETIDALGFVQIDSINTVARAHHMILSSRRSAYREKNLRLLYERDRQLFEHWTHDASFIPIESFPHWKHRFTRDAERLARRWREWQQHEFEHKMDEVLNRIAANGPVTSATVGEDETRSKGGWWEWHPSKTALEYLWRCGAISVTRREGFKKVYDLTENVIPAAYRSAEPTLEETIDWACGAAMDRLGFATSGEIAAFFDIVTPQEARDWCARQLSTGSLVEVLLEGADGSPPRKSFMRPEVLAELGDLERPRKSLAILSPFDPLLRDRKRATRLFNFRYTIEIFVPEAQRQYGYYVFPVIEGDQMIGRLDMKADRDSDRLSVRAYWPEVGYPVGKGRLERLERALQRQARFCELGTVAFAEDWLRGI